MSQSHGSQQPLPDKLTRVSTGLAILRHEQFISGIYINQLRGSIKAKKGYCIPREIVLSFIHTSNKDAASGTARDSGTGIFVRPLAYDASTCERLI